MSSSIERNILPVLKLPIVFLWDRPSDTVVEKSIGMETNLFQVSWATKIKFRDKLIHIALGFYNQELNWQGDAEIVSTLAN